MKDISIVYVIVEGYNFLMMVINLCLIDINM